METTTTLNEREKIELSASEARQIIYGDDPRFLVIEDDIVGKSRWSDCHKVVIQRVSDGKFFADRYRSGSTENQDERPWEYGKPDFRQVFPVEETIIKYL